MTTTTPAWLREPLLHFLVLGAALLGAHRLLWPSRQRITVTPEDRRALVADHGRRGGGPPGAAEEQALVGRFVDSEVLYREALARGLDRGDLIVRRRLIQKMEFLLEAEVSSEPAEAEIAAFLTANPARYALPERLSLEQVFVGSGRQDAAAAAAALRERLAAGAEPRGLGDPPPRGGALTGLSRAELAAALGEGLAGAAAALPEGQWSAPLPSPYGLHLLRLTARRPGRPAALAEVRERVRADLRAERRARALRQGLDRLRARYELEIAP